MNAYVGLFGAAAALGFAVAAPLGPTGAAAIRHGLTSGARAAFWIGMGAALTDLLYITATYFGLAPLLLRLPWLTPLLYLAGALVLGRIGLAALRQSATVAPVAPASPLLQGWRAPLLLGLGLTVVNPATITAWLSVGGAFVTDHLIGLPLLPALGVLLGILVGSAAWFTLLALLVGAARAGLGRLPWLLRAAGLLSGLVLLGFAVTFGLRGFLAITPWFRP